MFYVYVLESQRNKKRYIGFTAIDPLERLKEHNTGANAFTRANRPFKLVYTESFNTKEAALRREKFFKTGQGRRFLDRMMAT